MQCKGGDDMKLPIWYKGLLVLGACLLIANAAVIVLNCYSHWNQKEAVKEYKESQEAEDLVIDVPEPCTEGYLTVSDYAGVTHFQYEGEIIIENDGLNGEPINIQIHIPNEDPAYQLEEE